MNDFIFTCSNGVVSAFHTFASRVRGKTRTVNWFYTEKYRGNVPQSYDDPRDFHHAFDEWIRNCTNFVREGSTVIDIGCFTGDTTLPLAFLAGEEGRVLAFDPNPVTFKEFSLNAALNPSVNIEGKNVAIMPNDGDYNFLYQGGMENGGPEVPNGWTTITKAYPERAKFPGINLEKHLSEANLLENISFIKVDTEGFDNQILWSMPNIIQKNRPNILIEWLPTTERHILKTLEIFKYKAFHPETFQPIQINPNNRTQDVLLIPE